MKKTINDIVITGASALSAAGTGIAAIQELVRAGEDAFTAIPADVFEKEGYRWGKNSGFKASDFMPPMKARKMDRCGQFAVSAVGLALKDAGIDLKEMAPERVGIVLGSGFCGIASSAEFLNGYFSAGVEGLFPMVFPNTVPNAPASNASIEHGFKGPNATLVQRFCSAESAFLLACRYIEEGRADVMLTGGTDDLIPLMIKGFAAMGQMKQSAVSFGEGCGIIVLENAAHAARRLATVKGTVESITTIGMIVPGRESEALDLLTESAGSCDLVSLSGTAADMSALVERLSGKPQLDIGRVTGRSLAMGGTALPVLLSFLESGQKGLHLAASPQGPYFAIRVSGGSPVQS
ncbi:MAG: beta-ketoacyl synthase [Desulfuromonadales bacterium]|nr:beta-ketoacyl synthase [Desulfuromonadales bacterium]